MISRGNHSDSLEDILNVTDEVQLASHYLGVDKIPCIINSPLRRDNNPSFGLYSPDGKKVTFIDFSTKERGGLFDLLGQMWKLSFKEVVEKISKDFRSISSKAEYRKVHRVTVNKGNDNIDLKCKVREWRDYDIKYWESFGISLKWLKYANVYPISHKIVVKDNKTYVFGADKHAYAYVEFKDNKTTLKIYQPYNKNGWKWANKHDRSVISLWTKVPEYGEKICICSSLKDALCLWANTGIPAIAIQGEGYGISETAIKELKRRYKHIYILLDNDEAGLKDSLSLAESTGFTNLTLPKINNSKDVSDLYKSLKDKTQFKNIILNLFKNGNS